MRKLLLTFFSIILIIITISALSSCNIKDVYLPVEREIDEPIRGISINLRAADINVYPTDEGDMRVATYDSQRMYHSVTVEDGILVIELVDERLWFDHIFGSESASEVAVYLPEAEYDSLLIEATTGRIHVYEGMSFAVAQISQTTGDVEFYSSSTDSINIATTTGDVIMSTVNAGMINVSTTTGDIDMAAIECTELNASATTGSFIVKESTINGSLEIETSSGDVYVNESSAKEIEIDLTTGDVTLSAVWCDGLAVEASTSDVFLEDVIASSAMDIELTTGEVIFDRSDAKQIHVEASSGDVSGTLLSIKIFTVKTTTGYIDVPGSDYSTDETCEIETTTGNVTISIDYD